MVVWCNRNMSSAVPSSHGESGDYSGQSQDDPPMGEGMCMTGHVDVQPEPQFSGCDLYELWKNKVCPLLEDRQINVGSMPQMMVTARVACNRTLRMVNHKDQV